MTAAPTESSNPGPVPTTLPLESGNGGLTQPTLWVLQTAGCQWALAARTPKTWPHLSQAANTCVSAKGGVSTPLTALACTGEKRVTQLTPGRTCPKEATLRWHIPTYSRCSLSAPHGEDCSGILISPLAWRTSGVWPDTFPVTHRGFCKSTRATPPRPVPEVGQHQVQYPLPFPSLPSSIQGSEVLTPQGAELPGDSLKWVVVPGVCEVRCPGPNQGLAHELPCGVPVDLVRRGPSPLWAGDA